jgi:hypothetical protein
MFLDSSTTDKKSGSDLGGIEPTRHKGAYFGFTA